MYINYQLWVYFCVNRYHFHPNAKIKHNRVSPKHY